MVQLQAAGGIQHRLALLYAGDAGQDGEGAGGDDDLIRCIGIRTHLHGLGAGEHGLAGDDLDLVGLAQRANAGGQLLHRGGAEALDLLPVHPHVHAHNADLGAAGGGVIDLRGVEHGLGGHAAPIEAGAAHLILLDQRDLGAQLRGADGGHIAAGAAADHQDAAALGRSCRLGSLRRRSSGSSGGGGVGDALPRRADPAHQGLAGHGFAFLDQDFQQDAVAFALHIVGQLVSGHGVEDLALLHRVALFLFPLVDGALCHGQAQLGHQ